MKREAALLTTAIEDRNISFLRDLEAANALKSFLVGSGVEVPTEVLTGLAYLTEIYIATASTAVAPPLKESESAVYPAPPAPPAR